VPHSLPSIVGKIPHDQTSCRATTTSSADQAVPHAQRVASSIAAARAGPRLRAARRQSRAHRSHRSIARQVAGAARHDARALLLPPGPRTDCSRSRNDHAPCLWRATAAVDAGNPAGHLGDKGRDLRTMQDYLGRRDQRHIVHSSHITSRRFEGLWGEPAFSRGTLVLARTIAFRARYSRWLSPTPS
jgi:hypothetical protein